MMSSSQHRHSSYTGDAYRPAVAPPNDRPDSMGQIDQPLRNNAALPQHLRPCVFQYVPAINMQSGYVDATTASQLVQEDMSTTTAFQQTTNANDLSVPSPGLKMRPSHAQQFLHCQTMTTTLRCLHPPLLICLLVQR